MKIVNEDENETVKNLLVFLTHDEAKELFTSLENLLQNTSLCRSHEHISDFDQGNELTICLYDSKDLSFDKFNDDIRKALKQND